jgi:arylsulfatase A-like enzyme
VGYGPLLHTALQWFPLAHARATEPPRTAEEINRSALAWVRLEESAPFFLFLNYMDAHAPYMPPDPWLDRYPGRLSILLSPPPAVLAGDRDLTDEKLRHYRATYDGAVAYVDDQIGDLLARLGAEGRLENALVIVTSDHGEFLGEHGLLQHIVGPYDPVHRIPLLVRYPRAARQGVEHGWVQLVDIVPTVLDVAGLAATSPVDGEVLPRVKHPILIQQFPVLRTIRRTSHSGRGYTGMYDGPWKLVAFDDGTSLLFDVEADPAEEHDLWALDPARARVMRANLEEANRRFPRRPGPSTTRRDLEERLKAGGYVW